MNRDRLLKAIRDDLRTYVQANKGELSIAADPYHLLELLAEAPSGWRAVLHYAGDDRIAGEHPLDGSFRDNRIEVGVSANPGLVIDRDAALVEARPGGTPSILRLLDGVEDRVRSMRLTSAGEDCSEYFSYRGCSPVIAPDGAPLRAYILRFEITTAPQALGESDYRAVAISA